MQQIAMDLVPGFLSRQRSWKTGQGHIFRIRRRNYIKDCCCFATTPACWTGRPLAVNLRLKSFMSIFHVMAGAHLKSHCI